MIFLRNLRSHHFHKLLKLQKPLHSSSTTAHLISSNTQKSSWISSIFQRPFSLSAQFEHRVDSESIVTVNTEEKSGKTKKPLDVAFKEAVGLSEKLDDSESDGKEESDSETNELKRNLRELEEEVRNLKENTEKKRENLKIKPKKDDGTLKVEAKPKSLYGLFVNKPTEHSKKSGQSESRREEDPTVYKELSPDMVLFATHLYKEGYFRDANFLPRNKFDVACFENSYGRDFIKFAAEKFGRDNQEIAKWLSGSDLKKVALFGCPSLTKKNVFSAKRLRNFFKIQEDTVCKTCILKDSCKFVNQSVWKGDTNNLNLAVVMRVITLYALDSVPPQLVVTDELKASVSRLLKEVLNLSQTVA